MKHAWITAVVCLALAGCASTPERERRARIGRYDAMLSRIKLGATRADLRQLLPSSARVRPFTATASMLDVPVEIPFAWEIYALDADFSVVVSYSYQRKRWRQRKPAQGNVAALRPPVTANAVDEMLSGRGKELRIFPQPTDRIRSLPLRAGPTTILASLPGLVHPQYSPCLNQSPQPTAGAATRKR